MGRGVVGLAARRWGSPVVPRLGAGSLGARARAAGHLIRVELVHGLCTTPMNEVARGGRLSGPVSTSDARDSTGWTVPARLRIRRPRVRIPSGAPHRRGLAPITRGYEMHRTWVDGDEVCAIYDFKVETPVGAGSIPMAEWSVIRDGKLVSSRLLFDTAAFSALMPGSE